MRIKELPRASLVDILRAYWVGMKPQQWAVYTSSVAFALVSVFQLITPLFYKKFFDIITAAGNRPAASQGLVHLLIIILLLNAVSWLSFRIGLFILNRFEAETMARLKQQSFDYLIDHSHSFFSDNFSGALVQRVGRFSRSFERLYDSFIFNILPLTINIVGIVIVVWLQQPLIAILMLAWVFITLLGNYIFARWKLKYDLRAASADSATTARLADSIANQTTIASFVGSTYESKAFKDVTTREAKATRLAWNLSAISDGTQAALIVIIEFLLFYYGITFWQQGVITVGTFVLIQVYLLGLANQLWSASRVIRNIYEGFADAEEMVSILRLSHEVKDVFGAKPLVVTEGNIELNDISFSFVNHRPVLSDIKLSIRGGEKIALIGPSGAGKSTLMRLILRMYDLRHGTIVIDGQDTQRVTQASLREMISVVPQDPVLFHRSLLENIRYGRRDATDDAVIAAARLAHCDEFIEVLPEKYATFVGERGIKLSGGERQRVAIARAILKNAPILILDEATSSLDSHSEALIQDALDKLMKGKTTIVIAHRLSTIRKMDRIIVLQHGKIVEEGSHEDLISREGSLYKHLWTLQAGGFIPDR